MQRNGQAAVMALENSRSVGPVGAGLLLVMAALWGGTAQAQATITAHGISTFGDLKYPADMTHLDYVNPDAPTGGEMSLSAPGSFDSMNPYSAKGVSAAGSNWMLESILTGTADEIGSNYCLLCTTLEYPEDRSFVIFNLRDDVVFSDGTPMTSEDVVFSYETFLAKGLTDFRTVFAQQVQGAEALDAHRVKFTFKPGVATRDLPADVGGLPVFSKAHYIANNLNMEESTLIPYLGTGEYLLDKMEVGRTIAYKRDPDYWGRDLPLMVGQGNFDKIRFEYFADGSAAFEAFKGGAYTFRNENSAKQWATGYDFPAVTSGHVVKAELPSGSKATGQGFMFNMRKPQWQDIRVRDAISMMFNFEWSNKTLFYGLYARINSVWENSWLAATGVPTPEEAALLQPLVDQGLLDASILTDEAVMAPVSGDRQLDRGNLRKASALLDAAGWTVGTGGMRANADGAPLLLEFLSDNPQFDRVITPYVENLRALGVDAKLINVDNAQFETRVRPPNYDFDIITDNARSNYFSGSELKQYYGSETSDISVFNTMGLKNKAVDSLIETVMAASSNETLTVATKALDRVLRAQKFWVPQWYKNTHLVAYYDMYEHPATLPPYALGEVSFWWYNAEKAAALQAAGALN